MSLIELVIAVGILSIVVLTAMSIVNPIMKMKGQVDQSVWIAGRMAELRACLSDTAAWDQTVADATNTSLACLRNGTACLATTNGEITLRNTAGGLCIAGVNTASASNTGFTREGVACNGWTAAGNDNCPYRYVISWQARCAFSAANCLNPSITITGRMDYAPRSADARRIFNPGRYAINYVRRNADQARFFSAFEMQGAGTGGGICEATGSIRKLSIVQQSGTYISNIVGPSDPANEGTITLVPGSYSCHISAPAWMVGSHKIVLENAAGNPILVGTSEYAPAFWGYTQTRSEIYGAFTISVPTNVRIRHYCAARPANATMATLSMGTPMGAGPEVFATMACNVL